MSASRLCVLLVFLVSVKMMAAQPTFGRFFCDMFCDDDDDYDSDYSSFLDIFFDCSDCSESKPSKSKTTTPAPKDQQPISLMIPPANGMNLTLTNTGTSWLMNFIPWAVMPSAATKAPAASTPASATTAAGTTSADGTTAAPTTTTKAP